MVSDHLHSISQMVRTRATTAPTPTPARQETSEPAIGAVARGRVTARGRGRGRGRTSSRGRGQVPSPSDARAVTPPSTEEVVREGEEGENEQVQNEEMPPQPTPEMINQVLAYLSGLSDQRPSASSVFCTSTSSSGGTTCGYYGSPHGCLIGNRHVSLSDYRAYNDK